ncbi:MAG TPA: YceD family protein, partial [Bacteroidia bacterium]|nr:YceD family protein [Bacteroidia bacterium]
ESVHALDLSQYLYEYITLLLPSRKVCGGNPEGSNQCDPEMIEKLEELNPDNYREEGDSEEEEKPTDPRWDSLKNLKFDN